MRFDEIKKGEKDSNGYTRCWPGKHAEGTKKGKNGGQVRNCVPNESVNEMDKSQTPPGRDGGDPDAGKKQYTAKATTSKKIANDAEKILNKEWTKSLSKDKLDALAGPRYKKKGVAETVDIGQEWMSDTELDQYVPDQLQQQWRELLGYDRDGNPSALWANLTGGYEPDVRDPEHRALMVKVANKWFAAKKIPNVKFFDVKDADDELEWLVQIGQQGVAEGNAEYDDEAGMADNNLETMRRAVDGIDELIQPGDNLPEWCQEKIAIAKSMLVNVWDYMASEHDRGATSELAEEFNLIESCINKLADHNGVDPEMIWEDLDSLSDDELYVFAVTSEPIMESEAWQKANNRDKTDGMSSKAVKAYRREHPGSKLQTAVTTKPSKLKKGSKASKRRKSYCSRSRGQMKMHNISCAKTPDKSICKARRRWNC